MIIKKNTNMTTKNRRGHSDPRAGSCRVRILWVLYIQTQQDNQNLSVRFFSGQGSVRVLSGSAKRKSKNTKKNLKIFKYTRFFCYPSYIFENLKFYPKSKPLPENQYLEIFKYLKISEILPKNLTQRHEKYLKSYLLSELYFKKPKILP